ncbi:MAG: flagellar protein FliT [Burkholderiales bacterium]|nr:flagellar protein FliT [Burkholderiales bacterium]
MNAADTERLLLTYDRLSRTTGRMLSAARRGDWDDLVKLEQHCAGLVAELSSIERDEALSEGLRARKLGLIRKVLADDAAIRDITEPWMRQLDSMLDANRCRQRLLRAYGPSAPS